MKDEELWHSDRSELNEDRRDDRRDDVAPDPGPLGFIDQNQTDSESTGRVASEAGTGKGVSNEVETFTERDYDNERIEDDTSTRRDDELKREEDETLTNRERERRFQDSDEDRRETDRDFQAEGNALRGESEESPLPQDVPSDRNDGVPEDPSLRPDDDPTAHANAEDTDRSLPNGPGSPGQSAEGIPPAGGDDMAGPPTSGRRNAPNRNKPS